MRSGWLAALGLAGCIGNIGDGKGLDGTPPYETADACDAGMTVPLRRLSKGEYERTIVDLFGGSVVPSASFPESSLGYPFSSYADANGVSLPGAEAIMLAAEEAALQAIESLPALLPCDASSADRTCVEEMVRAFGKRAFRRPVRDDEVSRLMTDVYDVAEGEVVDRVACVLSAMLQMPQFLYLVEEGTPSDDGRTVRLTDYETASRLSYLLWGTMPDDLLLSAAEAGKLATKEGIEAEARRLLADRARAAPALVGFVRQWMGIDELAEQPKSVTAFPDWDELMPHLEAESLRFAEHVLFDGTGTLEELLTSPTAFVNAAMESFYGLPAQSAGDDDWREVELDAGERPGILTRPAHMAAFAHSEMPAPTLRGKFIRTQLLCETIPPPPKEAANVTVQGETLVDRSQWLIDHEFCGGCHKLLDGIGIGLMNYDAIGQWDAAGGPPGEVVGMEDGVFHTPAELMDRLAGSEELAACAVRQVFRYAAARDDDKGDRCQIEALQTALSAAGGDLRELMIALVVSDAFVVRVPEEVSP